MLKKLACWAVLAAVLCGHAWGQPVQGYNNGTDFASPSSTLTHLGGTTFANVAQNIIQRPGLRIQCFGDSRCANEISWGVGTSYGLAAGSTLISYNTGGPLVQAMHFLGGRVNFDYTWGIGPCPYLASTCYALITNGGSGYTSPPTVTQPGCSGASFGTAVISGGAVVGVPVTGAGASCQTGTALVFTGGGGTGAAGYSLSGAGGTWGIEGATSAQMLQYLSLAETAFANADIIEVACCVNDPGASISTAQTMTNWKQIVTGWLALGKTVLIYSPMPVGQTSAVTATNQQQVADQNIQMIEWARGYSQQRPTGWGSIIYAYMSSVCGDQAVGATDGFASKCSADSIHPNQVGSYIEGELVIAPALQPLLGPNSAQWIDTFPISAYNASTNLTGRLSVGNFYSVTGNGANSPFTGVTPLSWYLQQFSYGTGTFTGSVEAATTCPDSARSDCLPGPGRFKLTISEGSGTSSDQGQLTPFSIAVGSLPITVGSDIIYQEMMLDLSNVANANGAFTFILQCQATSGGTTLLQLEDEFQPPNSNTLGGPQAGTKMVMQTPRAACPSGTTYVNTIFGWSLNGSGAANSASFTALLSNYAMRKVQ